MGKGVRQRRTIWRSLERLVGHLKLDPWYWSAEPERIYDWFSSKALSVSYMRKTLIVLNQWGRFYSRYLNRVYIPVKAPSGHELKAVYDGYFTANDGRTCESDPLHPEELEAKRHVFKH